VLADLNRAQIGDPILQPGPHDGGRVEVDKIGQLMRYVPILYGAWPFASKTGLTRAQTTKLLAEYNEADAAIALPTRRELITPEILEIGIPRGVRPPELGLRVQKSGRTSALTRNMIEAVDVSMTVRYPDRGLYALFRHQIVTRRMSQPGDSGSLLLDYDNYAVGLLFAGSYWVTLYNAIGKVLDSLRVDLLTL
jgi:hypothetical protein